MKRFRLRPLPFALAALLLIAALVVWPVVREIRQDRRDQALIAAVKREDAPAVVRLLNVGADANARDLPDDKRPFWRLCWDLLRRRHQPTEKNTLTALMLVMQGVTDRNGRRLPPGNVLIMAALLKYGADPNTFNDRGYCPLSYALEYETTEATLLLIHHGAKVNGKDSGYNPWLTEAVFTSADPRVLDAMLQHGADINARSERGKTALVVAAERGNVPTVQFLLAHHANLTFQDSHGHTALDYIRSLSHTTYRDHPEYKRINRLLRQAGAR